MSSSTQRASAVLRSRVAAPLVRRLALAAERRPSVKAIFERSMGRPTLHELSLLAPLHPSADAFLADLLGPAWTTRRAEITAEHEQVQVAIAKRGETASLNYPAHFAIEGGTALILYATIRVTAPAVVVEVGVADGRSTATMLAAMEHNGVGQLHSVDISGDVGVLVDTPQRVRWQLHVVHPSQALAPVLAELGTVDVFIHDGDHTRAGQQRDASAAQSCLRPGGLFISDDAEWSYVFHDTCRAQGATPVMLVDSRKVLGAVRLG